MQNILKAIVAVLMSIVPVSSWAQTAVDGLRFGVEAAHSKISLRVHARKAREAALTEVRTRLSQGEANVLRTTMQLANHRVAIEAGSQILAETQNRLSEMKQLATLSSPQVAAALAPRIKQLEQQTTERAAALRAYFTEVAREDQEIATGRAQLEAGYQMLSRINAFPNSSTANLPGTSARFSLGWGSSFRTSVGDVRLGVEASLTPGTGDTVVQVPVHYDTFIKAGPSYGAAVRLGWTPTWWAMPYIIAGMETEALHVVRNTMRSTQRFTGFQGGVGIEFLISDNYTVQLGYDHALTFSTSFADAKITPSRTTYLIGLVRRF